MPPPRLSAPLAARGRRSVEREEIKAKVKERKIRLLVATDAACEVISLL
jgi:hypothetical protein